MNTDIRYIFLDLGGTFRVIDEDPAYLAAARAKIAELCGVKTEDPTQWFEDVIDKRYDVYREWALKYMCEAPEEVLWRRWLAYEEFYQMIEERYEPYRKWALGEFKESGDEELWCKWLLPDYDPVRIRQVCHELSFQYRQTKGRRTVVEGGADTVKELCRRGYTLGIISDLVGRREVDEWLDQDGLRPYFQTVQQSSVTYIRKPGPAIYYYAMEEVGAEPENCCYVGDNLNRDIIGAKAVDFGMTVTVQYQKDKPLKLTAENRPDAKVYRFPDLLDIFPKRGQVAVEKLIPPEDGQ